MEIKKCILTNSTCYKKAGESPKTGIVVHSTGVNNPYVKRYVQPMESDADYAKIIADIGYNNNRNDWNHIERNAGVHAFIGKNYNNEIVVYQTLPYEKDSWGVGSGKKGSYNYKPNARIQFEICEDGLTDEKYFSEVFDVAAKYCAHLCKIYGWDVDKICSHRESYIQGYGGNHGDPDHWLAKFGKNMDWFRSKVKAELTKSYSKEDYVDILVKEGIINSPEIWKERVRSDDNIYWLIRKVVEKYGKV